MAARNEEHDEAPGLNLPADVPAEFADAYRAAYNEALGEPEQAAEPPAAASHRRVRTAEVSALWSETWVKAAVGGLAAIVLVLGAYGIGKAFSSDRSDGGSSRGQSSDQSPGASSSSTPYDGTVEKVQVRGVTASCTAPPGVDAGGLRVNYRPQNVLDQAPSTAWRCDGRGVGESLTFALPHGARVAEVGLVPGYAKTDPANGMDRYAQNNRITEVRWTIGDRQVVQRFSGNPQDRSLRTLRIPLTEAGRVRLQVLSTVRGPRNTTAISTVRVATPQG